MATLWSTDLWAGPWPAAVGHQTELASLAPAAHRTGYSLPVGFGLWWYFVRHAVCSGLQTGHPHLVHLSVQHQQHQSKDWIKKGRKKGLNYDYFLVVTSLAAQHNAIGVLVLCRGTVITAKEKNR